ncbi:uncharacterized protein FTJAE_2892 [Fusarium tjaetaba]|uniref:Uncharacterized protein n=1 Tax=Fusarium tjaetaba TaxID=1567544 RepID=A0A8H5S2Q6_9HYPO|nr:uncharacterized protein FTJAE_2892 [Fusarium tjaetaba]KAF5644203.1 hypothetical protein FTJAE_2892 [Fusarium tjaetaba]
MIYDHGVGVVIDVLSGEDEAQGDIDRTLLSERDQNPHRLADSLMFTTQLWANEALPDTNPLALRAEPEEARRGQSPGADSTGSSITFLPSSPRQVTGGVNCFPIPELERNTHIWHTAYSDALAAYLQNLFSESGEISLPDNMTKHIIRLQGPEGRYRETIEAGSSPGREYSLSDMMYDERWLMEAPPRSQESSLSEQDDSTSSSTSVYKLSQYRDYEGKGISVYITGEQAEALWHPQQCQAPNDSQAEDYVDGWRKSAAPIVIFQVLPRASIATSCLTKYALRNAAAERLLRPSTDSDGIENVYAVVVGTSATDLHPVVMVRPESAPTQTDDDNVDSMQRQTIMKRPF